MTKRTLNRNNKNKRKFAKKSRQSVGWKFSQLVTKNFVDERKTYESIVSDELPRYAINTPKWLMNLSIYETCQTNITEWIVSPLHLMESY